MKEKRLYPASGVCITGLVLVALIMPWISPQAAEPTPLVDPELGAAAPVSEEYLVLQAASPDGRVDEDGALSLTPEGAPGGETVVSGTSSGESTLTTGPLSATILPLTLPTPRHHFSAVYDPGNGKMYTFGGYHHPLPYIVYAGIYAVDIAASQITFVTNLPTPRLGTAAVFSPSQQKAYVFGGHDGETVFDDIVEFDPSTGIARRLDTDLPGRRRFAAAAYVPETNKAYVIGGSDYVSASSPGLRTIFEIDLGTMAVRDLGEVLPTGLHLCAAVYAPGTGKIYVFGGANELNEPVADIVEFDPITEQAAILPAGLPGARSTVAAMLASPSQYAYALGGKSAEPSALDSIVELRTPTGEVATSAVSLPLGLYSAGSAYDTQQRNGYLLGGYVSSSLSTIIEIEFEIDPPFRLFLPSMLRQWGNTRMPQR